MSHNDNCKLACSGLYVGSVPTVWKFHDFSITHIFREIIFSNYGGLKTAILTQLEALNFDFYEFLHLMMAEIYQINKVESP